MTDDEMVGWHDRLNEHEFEQVPGVGDGQGKYRSQLPFPSPGYLLTQGLNSGFLHGRRALYRLIREPQTEQDSVSNSVSKYKLKGKVQLCLGKVKQTVFLS